MTTDASSISLLLASIAGFVVGAMTVLCLRARLVVNQFELPRWSVVSLGLGAAIGVCISIAWMHNDPTLTRLAIVGAAETFLGASVVGAVRGAK